MPSNRNVTFDHPYNTAYSYFEKLRPVVQINNGALKLHHQPETKHNINEMSSVLKGPMGEFKTNKSTLNDPPLQIS